MFKADGIDSSQPVGEEKEPTAPIEPPAPIEEACGFKLFGKVVYPNFMFNGRLVSKKIEV